MKKTSLGYGFALFIFTSAFADPVAMIPGEVYQGELFINDHDAHKACKVIIEAKSDLPTLGSNCTKAQISFDFGVTVRGYSLESVPLYSSITNDHLAEYPNQKTCSLNRDGSPLDQRIYTVSDDQIYNRILSGDSKSGWVSFDYFLKISPDTRLPISGALHRLAPLREDLYECENLTKIN
jgi:hypothetical protein